MSVIRPIVRYHGGKWRLANWIINHFPPHRIYTESFGGGASVLLRKAQAYSEVYNDLDGEIVNLFRVLRNPSQGRELIRLVTLTPFSREEFEYAFLADGDPVEQARRTMLRSFAGHGTNGIHRNTGFRGNVTRSGTIPAHDWRNLPAAMEAMIERLRGVVVEHMPAIDLLSRYDASNALHYVDPPYVHDTRGNSNRYNYEMTDTEHGELADVLCTLDGMVVLSGYRCELYDDLYARWQRLDRQTYADGAHKRIESLWISPNAVRQPTLF